MMEDRRSPVLQLRWTSPPVVLASIIIIGFFASLFTMLLVTKDSTDIMIGALIAAVSSVIGYFFGSSSQSAGKDVAIAQLTKTAATVATAQAAQAEPTTLKVQDVAIDAQSVTVDSQPPKGNP